MIDVEVVDAHHHLQDLSRSYPWLEGDPPSRYHGDDRPLRRNYLLDDYLADVGVLPLGGSIHVENGARDAEAETAWIQSLHEARGLPSAHVAYVDLLAPDAPARLERAAAHSVVRGVRYQLNWHEDPFYRHVERADLLDDPAWRTAFARLAPLGLSFDLQLFPAQLKDAVRLARAHPETRIVLDHAAMPIRRDPEGLDFWRRELTHLAALPNVTVKISALGTNDHAWTRGSIAPIVRDTIELFGARRTMFASNFPVDGLYSSLAELYRAFDELTADASRDERRRLFGATARDVYRLGRSAEAERVGS